MTRFNDLKRILEHRVRIIWVYLFIFFSGTFLTAVVGRYAVLEPRNVDIVFKVLRRLGVPICAQGATFQWKWGSTPHFTVDMLRWDQDGKVLSMKKAIVHLRFNMRHPLQRFFCQELEYTYATEQRPPSLDYLATCHTLFAAFKTCAFMEACQVQRIRVHKDQELYVSLKDISWDTQMRQKLIGRIETPKGEVVWSYCPKEQFFSARLTQGVQRVLNDLGYSCSTSVPIVFEARFTPKDTHVTIGWDDALCTLEKAKHRLHKAQIHFDCSTKDIKLFGVLGMDGLSLNLEGEYHRTWQLAWKSQGALSIQDLKVWWNKAWAPDAQVWVNTHFDSKYGNVRTLCGKILGTEETIESLHGSFDIVSVVLQPVPGMPEIQKLCAQATFDLKHFHFAIQEGLFSQQKICSGSVHIAELSGDTQLVLGTRLEGSVEDVLRILGCKRLDVSKDIPILRPKGKAYTSLRMRFPLISDLRLNDVVLDYESGLEKTSFDLTLFKTVLAYETGKIYIKGSQHEIAIEGTGQLDHYPATWSWKGTFGRNPQHKLIANVWINPSPWLPNWCKTWVSNQFLPLKLDYVPGKKILNAVLDLSKASLHIPWVKWKKSSSVPLSVQCTFLESTQEAKLFIKGAAEGEGSVSTGAIFKGWGKIHLPKACNVHVKLAPEGRHLDISARYLDLKLIRDTFVKNSSTRTASKHPSSALDLHLKCNLQTVQWDKEHVLKGLRGTIRCKQHNAFSDNVGLEDYRWSYADVHTTIRNKKSTSVVHILAHPQGHDTSIKCIVKELSALSSLCGLEKVLRSADSGEWIGYQRKDGSYQGRLVFRGIVTKGLWAVKLLSLLSPMAVTELLHSSLDFAEVSVNTLYKNHTLHLNKGIAKGINLGGFLSGTVDMRHGKLFLKGGLVPAYVLNTVLSHVPLIGALLGEEKGIISSQFVITGTLDDPNFLVNPLSIFELGGLKDLFE